MHRISLNITEILLMQMSAGDTVMLFTDDLTVPMPRMEGNRPSLRVDCAMGYGKEWCEQNFPGIPITVQDTRQQRDIVFIV